jgi:uncharacterized glyoxalase superfamily protein PhnB
VHDHARRHGASAILTEDAELEYESPADKGRTPRLECVVDDVSAAVARFIRAGGTLRVRTSPTYAHVIDPFGHLWAFAA